MLVEIHVVQNHAPSNLNRDDTGSPKDCIFGGVRRSRISSQCIKRSVRRSPLFEEGLEGADLGIRTRHLPQEVKKLLLGRGLASDLAEVAAEKASGFGNSEGKEQPNGLTAQAMFLTKGDIHAVASVLHEAATAAGSAVAFRKVGAGNLQEKAELRGWRPITADIALFGRMTTSGAFRDVEAAMQVAHAISTHKMDHEFDYFTAVDDLQGLDDDEDAGACHINDTEFNSACYYKYFSLDLAALIANLAGPEPRDKAPKADHEAYASRVAEAKGAALRVVDSFIRAAVFTTPTGKQNSFAAHQLPDAILAEVRCRKTPVSYANAFVKPARAHGEVDLVEDSLAKFSEHVGTLTRKFSLETSPRLWFSTREATIPGTVACDSLDELLARLGAALEGANGQ
jgi:CRISPR system Cascade subunit CasC